VLPAFTPIDNLKEVKLDDLKGKKKKQFYPTVGTSSNLKHYKGMERKLAPLN